MAKAVLGRNIKPLASFPCAKRSVRSGSALHLTDHKRPRPSSISNTFTWDLVEAGCRSEGLESHLTA